MTSLCRCGRMRTRNPNLSTLPTSPISSPPPLSRAFRPHMSATFPTISSFFCSVLLNNASVSHDITGCHHPSASLFTRHHQPQPHAIKCFCFEGATCDCWCVVVMRLPPVDGATAARDKKGSAHHVSSQQRQAWGLTARFGRSPLARCIIVSCST